MMPPMTTMVASNGPSARRKPTGHILCRDRRGDFVKWTSSRIMARGWESKSVEAQQADKERRETPSGPDTPEARARAAHRRTLELALFRAKADLETAAAPGYRAMLERAIATLEEQLGADDRAGGVSR
jgi:hypothetical protein